jgi:hypothetical protein
MLGRILLVLGLVAILSLGAAAQDLKTQKLIDEANDALYQAKLHASTKPKAIKAQLQKALAQIEKVELPKKYQALVSELRSNIDKLDQALGVAEKESEKIIKDGLRKQEEARLALQKLETKQANEIADRFITSNKDRLESQKRIRDMRERGLFDTLQGIDETYTNSFKENRMPERYLWALANRHTVKMAKEEVSILKALKSPLTLNWDKIPLKQAIEYLQDKGGLTIRISEDTLKEAKIEYEDEKVTVQGKNVTARAVLRKILGERGLGYIIKNGEIVVLTAEQAREQMTTRLYPVADLVAGGAQFGVLQPFVSQQNAATLIQVIQNTVDPDIWKTGGATITFDPAGGGTFSVRAPAELHLMLGFGSKK